MGVNRVSAAKVGRDLQADVPGQLSMTISHTGEIDVGTRNATSQRKQDTNAS